MGDTFLLAITMRKACTQTKKSDSGYVAGIATQDWLKSQTNTPKPSIDEVCIFRLIQL